MEGRDYLNVFLTMFEALEIVAGPGYSADEWNEEQQKARDYVYGLARNL